MNILEVSEVLANLAGIAKSELEAGLKKTAEGDELKSKEDINDFLDSVFSDKFKEIGQTNLKRGRRESLTSLEKEIKKTFEVDSKLQGIDLVNAVIDAKKGSPTNPPKDSLTKENAKDNPIVQELLKEQFDEIDTLKKEYEDYKTSIISKEHSGVVRSALRKEFLALNPVLPTDETKKERAIDRFVNSFDTKGFKVTADNEIIPVDDNGDRKKDKRFNALTVKDVVTTENYFDLHKQDPKKSSPSPQTQGRSGGKDGSDVPMFKTEEELNQYINTVGDATKAQAALAQYRETETAED